MAGFEGQTVFSLLTRKLDRSGCLKLCGLSPAAIVSLQTHIPLPFVEVGLARLLQIGLLEHRGDVLVDPTYIAAQETSKSDKQRQRESRDRRRATALSEPPKPPPESRNVTTVTSAGPFVTPGHEPSQVVTLTSAVLCGAEQTVAVAAPPPAPATQPKADPIPRIGVDTVRRRPLGQPDPAQEAAHQREQAERMRPPIDASLTPDGREARKAWKDVCDDRADVRGNETVDFYEGVAPIARRVVCAIRDEGFEVQIGAVLRCGMYDYYIRQKREKGRVKARFLPMSDDFIHAFESGLENNPPNFRPVYVPIAKAAAE
jgi:hypothetical protein